MTQPNPISSKTILIVFFSAVGAMSIFLAIAYLVSIPRQVGDGAVGETRALTTEELAKRCTEKFYGDAGRQCMHDVYTENSALPEEYKAKKRYGLE